MVAQKLKSKIITTPKGGIGMTFDIEFIKTLMPSEHLWIFETDGTAPVEEEKEEQSEPQRPVRIK